MTSFSVEWNAGSGDLASCHKVAKVFGIPLCVTQQAFAEKAKCDHIANVLAQLLDNNADGKVNDAKVHKYMTDFKYFMWIPKGQSDPEIAKKPTTGIPQLLYTDETVINSCDIPTNRGATTDRSTWVAKIDSQVGCAKEKDASVEEVFHLITDAATKVNEAKWGASPTSTVGKEFQLLNGNCGWGYTNNWKDPSGAAPTCSGKYAYKDTTCNSECVVIEGIYWASVTWMGGFMTTPRMKQIADEWQMPVPDASMKSVVLAGQKNAKTMQEGGPALYAMISDTKSAENLWLPSIMPDGKYKVKSVLGSSASAKATATTAPKASAKTATTAAPKASTKTTTTAATKASSAEETMHYLTAAMFLAAVILL